VAGAGGLDQKFVGWVEPLRNPSRDAMGFTSASAASISSERSAQPHLSVLIASRTSLRTRPSRVPIPPA
jgi:hypothetical protein